MEPGTEFTREENERVERPDEMEWHAFATESSKERRRKTDKGIVVDSWSSQVIENILNDSYDVTDRGGDEHPARQCLDYG